MRHRATGVSTVSGLRCFLPSSAKFTGQPSSDSSIRASATAGSDCRPWCPLRGPVPPPMIAVVPGQGFDDDCGQTRAHVTVDGVGDDSTVAADDFGDQPDDDPRCTPVMMSIAGLPDLTRCGHREPDVGLDDSPSSR